MTRENGGNRAEDFRHSIEKRSLTAVCACFIVLFLFFLGSLKISVMIYITFTPVVPISVKILLQPYTMNLTNQEEETCSPSPLKYVRMYYQKA